MGAGKVCSHSRVLHTKIVPGQGLDEVKLGPVVDEQLPALGEHEAVRVEEPVSRQRTRHQKASRTGGDQEPSPVLVPATWGIVRVEGARDGSHVALAAERIEPSSIRRPINLSFAHRPA